ncbi:hypothetical protein BESB_076240 [Besnoitia besnoiti]|uniref:Uncharacterized protein n=1 Tax=Besnoitia besnoiti TaxID=94643 RepID=A0A2A9MCT3_BESBE|nr:hypothetical protein BESB_076240 [Besnoitia besnoiti]PFH33407.1 hypothetical protein BESB_076240 [Besnoitia besnoiti]
MKRSRCVGGCLCFLLFYGGTVFVGTSHGLGLAVAALADSPSHSRSSAVTRDSEDRFRHGPSLVELPGASAAPSVQRATTHGESEKDGPLKMANQSQPRRSKMETANSRAKAGPCSGSHASTQKDRPMAAEKDTKKGKASTACGLHASLRQLPQESASPETQHLHAEESRSKDETEEHQGRDRAALNIATKEGRKSMPKPSNDAEQAVVYVPLVHVFPIFMTPSQRWSAERFAQMVSRGSLLAFAGFEPLY